MTEPLEALSMSTRSMCGPLYWVIREFRAGGMQSHVPDARGFTRMVPLDRSEEEKNHHEGHEGHEEEACFMTLSFVLFVPFVMLFS